MARKNTRIERLMAAFKAETGVELTAHEQKALAKASKAARERERYANDPEYRARKAAQALEWQSKNPKKVAKSKKKWNREHATEAMRRHRAKKRAEKENSTP